MLPGLQVIFNKHFLIKFKSKSIVSGTDTQILRILQIFGGKRLKKNAFPLLFHLLDSASSFSVLRADMVR